MSNLLVETTATHSLLIAALVKLLEKNGALPVGAYSEELNRTLSFPGTAEKLSAGGKATLEHMVTLLQLSDAPKPTA